jgi:hypothetical protein
MKSKKSSVGTGRFGLKANDIRNEASRRNTERIIESTSKEDARKSIGDTLKFW